MLEVYQKRTFIEIDTNIRKFSAIFLNVVFKENAYYRKNEKTFFLHITLNRCWNLKDSRDQVLDIELCYRLFYGCSRRFYEIRQKEQKIERNLENNMVAIICTGIRALDLPYNVDKTFPYRFDSDT